MRDRAGNLEPSFDVYPNGLGPVVRHGEEGERALVRLLWGMPTLPERVKGKADYGTSGIRTTGIGSSISASSTAVTSFSEPSPKPGN